MNLIKKSRSEYWADELIRVCLLAITTCATSGAATVVPPGPSLPPLGNVSFPGEGGSFPGDGLVAFWEETEEAKPRNRKRMRGKIREKEGRGGAKLGRAIGNRSELE